MNPTEEIRSGDKVSWVQVTPTERGVDYGVRFGRVVSVEGVVARVRMVTGRAGRRQPLAIALERLQRSKV